MAGRVAYYGGIVKDGLVLDLDAAKKDSYGRTGTTWSDISGNQRNATLTSPVFTTEGGGGFTTGTINYPIATTLYPTEMSLEVTLRVVTTVAFAQYLDYGQIGSVSAGKLWFRGSNAGNGIQFNVIGNTTTGTQAILGGTTHDVSTTKVISVILRNTGVAVCYINGVQVQTGTVTNFVSWQIDTTAGRINTGNFVANLKIYNRALTAQEVLQNYNATKGRYGL